LLLNRQVLEGMLARPLGNSSAQHDRASLERARSMGAWLDEYDLVLDA
jgi:hypothetical protein